MQDGLLLLVLLTAHLLGDFVLQTRAMVAGKSANDLRAFLAHGVVHYLLAYGTVLFFVPEWLGLRRLHLLLFLLVVLHLAIDLVKERLLAKHLSRHTAFTVDQILHLLLLLVVVGLMAPDRIEWLTAGQAWLQTHRRQILWLLTVYLGTIFGGGYLIRVLLPLGDETGDDVSDLSQNSLQKGGMYIGWLERFVILTAVLAKSPTLIGLIITAKSIVRFKKLESDLFAEYYLLGTFLSLGLALLGGVVLLLVLASGTLVPLE